MEVCLRRISCDSVRIGLRWISTSPVFVRVAIGWILLIYGSLHRWDDLPMSTTTSFAWASEMTVACLWLAPVLLLVARWSTDLGVVFIIFSIPCTGMTNDE